MVSPAQDTSPVGLIAAGGAMPFAVADSLAARGIRPVLFAIKGACDAAKVERYGHHWISVGQLGRATRLLREEGCRDLIFIGSLVRPALSEIRFDLGTLRAIPQIWASFGGGDDHLATHRARPSLIPNLFAHPRSLRARMEVRLPRAWCARVGGQPLSVAVQEAVVPVQS